MELDRSAIDQLLGAAVENGGFHGVSAIVVDRDGVLFVGGAGEVREDTMFRNASMTKAPATVGALQLVEQGLLELEAPVDSVVSEFGELQVLDGFDGEEPLLRPPASKATVRQLMNHTAGCSYEFANENHHRYVELTDMPSLFEGRKASLMAPLGRDPGTLWEYGLNTDWLGLVIEAVSGEKLDAYLAENLYGPLGMSDTTFFPTPEQRARLMELKFRSPEGELQTMELEPAPEPEWASGGHGSYGTLEDYGRFMRAMLRDGELDGARILAPETVELAFSEQLDGVPLPKGIKSADPVVTNDVPSLPIPQGWGLGFHLIQIDVPGGVRSGTGDWAGIFNTYYWIDRAAGVAGALMTQVLPFFDVKTVETLFALQASVYSRVGGAAAVG
jgi:methyl acetate hydrolase